MVSITDRPYMTSAVYHGRKARNQSINQFWKRTDLIAGYFIAKIDLIEVLDPTKIDEKYSVMIMRSDPLGNCLATLGGSRGAKQ